MAIDHSKGPGAGPRPPVATGNSETQNTQLGQLPPGVNNPAPHFPQAGTKKLLWLVLPWLNLMGGRKSEAMPPAPQAEPQRPPVPLLHKEKTVFERQKEKTFVRLDSGAREENPFATPAATVRPQNDPSSKVRPETLVPGALFGRTDNTSGADNDGESFREYLRKRGLLGIAQWIWYDPEKGRPASLKASAAVNSVLVAVIILWLLKWFE